MELKTARLTLLIDPNKKAAFERLCSQLDLTASQVVRHLIRDFLAQPGVASTTRGRKDKDAGPAAPPLPAPSARGAAQPGKPAKGPRSR